MRWFRFAVFIVFIMVLQASLVDIVALGDARLDLLLILLVFFSVYCNTTEAIITSFAIGFAADIVGPVIGPYTVSFGLFGTLLAYLHRVIAIRKFSSQSVAIGAIGVVAGTLAVFLTFLKGEPTTPNICLTLLGSSLYSAVVGPFFFSPSAWWMRIKTHRFGKQ